MSKFWRLIAGGMGILVTVLFGVLQMTQRQRDKAKDRAVQQQRRADSAEASIDQRQRAEEASEAAKEEGDARVDQVRHEARAGRRDHFSVGMRDNDD